jgi:hypothetical protein
MNKPPIAKKSVAINTLWEKYDDKITATIPPSSVAPIMIG